MYGRLNFTGHCDGQDRGVVLETERRFAFRPIPPQPVLGYPGRPRQ